jgi:SAM-dependent methyltransferase
MAVPFRLYDKRGYETADSEEGYKVWSEIYDETLTEWMTISLLQQVEMIQWRDISTAVDLACGTGKIGQWLKQEQQIEVLDGIDNSPQMLALAKEKNIYRNVLTENILSTSLPTAGYDLAINALAVCHIQQLDQFYEEVERILRDGGYFLLVDYHPFFLIHGIPTHFKQPDGGELAIENWVHLFSDHIIAGMKHTFRLLEMREQLVTQEWVKVAPTMEKHLHKPVSFVLVWKKEKAWMNAENTL